MTLTTLSIRIFFLLWWLLIIATAADISAQVIAMAGAAT